MSSRTLPNWPALDRLSDDGLAFAMDLRRHGINLCLDPRQTRAQMYAEAAAAGPDTPEGVKIITRWMMSRHVRAALRGYQRRVRVPGGWLWVEQSEWLTPPRWARLKWLAPELFQVLSDESGGRH